MISINLTESSMTAISFAKNTYSVEETFNEFFHREEYFLHESKISYERNGLEWIVCGSKV